MIFAVAVAAALAIVVLTGHGRDGERAPPGASGGVLHYTCSMDPSVEADRPGKCPLCGMDLTPVTEEHGGPGTVRISAEGRLRMGLQVARARKQPLVRRVVAPGAVVAGVAAGAAARVGAEVHGDDVAAVEVGHAALVALHALPLDRFAATVVEVSPDPAADTARVGLAVVDPGAALRPGMLAEAHIDLEPAVRLAVPEKAVIHVGPERVVFVDRGAGRFEPRKVLTGLRAGGLVEVVAGLEEGEGVVIAGTFLLAAESRIRSGGTLSTGGAAAEAP
jgi:hypothetical protein